MNIYIMSRGRAGKVNTLNWIPTDLRLRNYLVVGHGEGAPYQRAYPSVSVVEAPHTVTNYSQKLQWIMDGLPVAGKPTDPSKKCLIMDDDLVFSVPVTTPLDPTSTDTEYKTRLISVKDPELLIGMYEQIANLLDSYALVGVHPRQMGQHAPRPYVLNGRIICMQGINREFTGPIKVDQFPILADVVLNCTLLARGQANSIITTFFQDHGPCQAAGGCSIYRTPAMQREAVEYLAARFPGFVKVVQRTTKDGWLEENGVRYDYTCQWKALYNAGLAASRGLRNSPDTEVRPNPPREG